jgi:hypothetical protein
MAAEPPRPIAQPPSDEVMRVGVPTPKQHPHNATVEFYYLSGLAVVGPLTGIELREAAFANKVVSDTLVTNKASGPWVAANRVNGLFDIHGRPLPHPPDALRQIEQRRIASEAVNLPPMDVFAAEVLPEPTPRMLPRRLHAAPIRTAHTSRIAIGISAFVVGILSLATVASFWYPERRSPMPNGPNQDARVIGHSSDYKLRGLVFFLQDNLDVETVLYDADPDDVVIYFSGNNEAQRRALGRGTVESFNQFLRLQTRQSTVTINVEFSSAVAAAKVGPYEKRNGIAWAWGRFRFQGDPRYIRRIQELLRE